MDDFTDDTSMDKEVDKSKLISILQSNLKQTNNKSKLLTVLTYVMHQAEIYFNESGSGSMKKEIVLTVLGTLFENRELLEHSIEYVLKNNKIFKKKLKNKFKNYFARRQLKKRLRK